MGVASSPGPQRPAPVGNPTWLGGRRAEPTDAEVLDLVALVAAFEPADPDGDLAGLSSDDRRILDSCHGAGLRSARSQSGGRLSRRRPD
jgi:hypothetical protein